MTFPARTLSLANRTRRRRLAVITALLIGASGAHADGLVQIAPHRAAGPLEAPADTPPLFGYLARPELRGRRPAVVVC
jgi:hypothetical protein